MEDFFDIMEAREAMETAATLADGTPEYYCLQSNQYGCSVLDTSKFGCNKNFSASSNKGTEASGSSTPNSPASFSAAKPPNPLDISSSKSNR